MSFRFLFRINGSLDGSESVEEHVPSTMFGGSVTRAFYSDYDEYSFGTKLAFVFLGWVVIAMNILAITTLNRTKKIPYASKLLSTGTFSFDLCFIILSTVRKFIKDPTTNLAFQVIGSLSYHLSLLSVMMMSVERYFLFYYPMRYLKIVTDKLTRVLTFTTWSLYVLSFASMRYGVCYLDLESMDVFKQAGVCNNILVVHLGICLFFTSTISCICNWKVLLLIKSKHDAPRSASALSTSGIIRFYKSTGLVLTHAILILLTTTVYGIVLIAVRFYNLCVLHIRISFESVSVINCLLEPVLYMVWFKECQMHLLKFFGIFNKRFVSKAEEMRIEIFEIITSENVDVSASRKVEIKTKCCK